MTESLIPIDEQPSNTAASYQATRLDALPAVYKTAHERLACELALGMEEPGEIMARYGYDTDHALALLESPAFTVTCARVGKEVRESGLSFKLKARAQAEELLSHSFEMATDPLAAAAVRADLIKWTARVAGYEPKNGEGEAKTGGGFNLTIQFAGQAPMQVMQHEPLTISQGD